jgi:hypothetical protein
MTQETENGRHPVRFLVKLLVFIGIVAAAAKFLVSKRDEYSGLTEDEARTKMESKLAPRVGEEKAGEIADQVIPVLKDRGLIKSSGAEQAMDEVSDMANAAKRRAKSAAADAMDTVSDTADKAGDKAKNAAEKVADKAKKAADDLS